MMARPICLILRVYVSLSEITSGITVFENLLLVKCYRYFGDFQMTVMCAQKLRNDKSKNLEILSDDKRHVLVMHLGFKIFQKCLV